jgi:hypothetical protein
VRASILSADVERRNLSKGQQAMARALLKPEPQMGGARTKGESNPKKLATDFSGERLRQPLTKQERGQAFCYRKRVTD